MHEIAQVGPFRRSARIYLYMSQSMMDAFIDCTIGKMVQPISQSFFGQRKQVLIEKFATLTMTFEFFFAPSWVAICPSKHGMLFMALQ